MKKNMSSASTRRRRFAWKMLAFQIVLTAAQISVMFHHLAVLKYEWSFAYVSCVIGCTWFSYVPLVQLFVWMSSFGFMYSEAMFSVLEEITRENSSRSEETSLRQLKTVLRTSNVLLSFKYTLAKTYGHSTMVCLICNVSSVVFFLYNSFLRDGDKFVYSAIQAVIFLMLTCLIPAFVMDGVR
jgi:hypothetical protein